MPTSSPSALGRIFISYRREDTAYPAGWLFDQLTDHFGAAQVFKDVDSIQMGDDFVEVLTRAVESCDVLLALIGEEWLTITDAQGRRRLDDPDDFVRLEIETALARDIRVIPVLVDGAHMPRADQLPSSLVRLTRRQALELSPARFNSDTRRLLKVLDRALMEVPATPRDDWAPKQPTSSTREPTSTPSTPRVASAPQGPLRPYPDQRQPSGMPRRRLSKQARILTGAGVGTVLVLVLLVVALVSRSATTPPSTGTDPTASLPASAIIFRDDFSSRAAGWEGDGSDAKGAGYTGGRYRISAPPSPGGAAGSSPTKASGVYPAAPPDIRIQVEGRRLPVSDQSMEYGILCRINGNNAYVLTISEHYAKIAEFGAKYKILAEGETAAAADVGMNRLQAVCTSVEGQKAVHLELWVNGQMAVRTTDRDTPIPTGRVGLVVGTDHTTRPSVAEFDNFVVWR